MLLPSSYPSAAPGGHPCAEPIPLMLHLPARRRAAQLERRPLRALRVAAQLKTLRLLGAPCGLGAAADTQGPSCSAMELFGNCSKPSRVSLGLNSVAQGPSQGAARLVGGSSEWEDTDPNSHF